ncbi:3-carboxy-cis,cis-muconate cycloisomerase [Lutibaculum baratangense]|uniref:3-carboxy-cis,cis-muconate cycloisomerase n=1 Tax=Lutibaculum baratangense AMV1 TaxID=631454 RepID=V4QRV1_9HYPH|nr:3-carboxy-cis,cis-muconate cycloisomerase [Lutibaculum baratangense]ESR22467.1 3-carboxy-cis,cis-muconate cycloisomerase [Lutibaculum baratangense AMV1]
MQHLLRSLFSTPDVAEVFSDEAELRAMAAFEVALAAAEAEAGVIPHEAARAIAEAAEGFRPDIGDIAEKARLSGNPAFPFVAAFGEACSPEGRPWVHWGATSQDVLDTARALQLKSVRPHVRSDLERISAALAKLAERYRTTPMPGRTLLQPAMPTTFGMKAAGWLDQIDRSARHLDLAFEEAATLQFGGAVGTLSALGESGPAVRAALARRLGLHEPDVTWHVGRDRFLRLASEAVILMAGLAKIARDIALLMQAEIAEAAEPAGPGRGGSSTMPQKRNPVAAPAIVAAYHAAQGALGGLLSGQLQEHERGVGGWHAEWLTLPQIMECLAGALSQTAETVEGLEVDERRMRQNLSLGNGTMMSEALMMRLAGTMGRGEAKTLVGKLAATAMAEGRPLREVAVADPTVTRHLSQDEIEAALAPENYLGVAPHAVDRVVARWKETARNRQEEHR